MYIRVFFAVLFLAQLSAVRGQLEVFPVSSALLLDDTLTLRCRGSSSEPTAKYDWQWTTLNSALIPLVDDCQVNPSYASQFQTAVEPEGGCNLVFVDSKYDMAGRFSCQHGFDQGSADIVVLGSNTSCTHAPSSDLIAGDPVTLDCSISYNGSASPLMLWRADDGTPINNATGDTSPTQVNSRLTVPVYPPTSRIYSCETFFDPPIAYSYTWYSPAIDIQHPPSEFTVTGSGHVCGELYANVTSLHCASNGFPAPTYSWTDLLTATTVQGPDISSVGPGTDRYLCNASNVIRGQTHSDSVISDLIVLDEQPPEVCPGPESGCGAILRETPEGTLNTTGFHALCYLNSTVDTVHAETPCIDLIQELPMGIVDGADLVAKGGNFGCWLAPTGDFSGANGACFDNYQHNIKMSSCPTCPHLYVCIKMP